MRGAFLMQGGVKMAATQARTLRKKVARLETTEERIRRRGRETFKAQEAKVRFWKSIALAFAALSAFLGLALALKANDRDIIIEDGRATCTFVAEENADRGDLPYAPVALAQMPRQVWATGKVKNGPIWGSCGNICVGDEVGYGLSCGHCFTGIIGGTFKILRPDGKEVEAVLIAHRQPRHDGDPDLSLYEIAACDVLDVAPIEVEVGEGAQYSLIGFPHGVGPEYHALDSRSNFGDSIWTFRVADGGRIQPGNSGSLLFDGPLLCAVVFGANNEPMSLEGDLGDPVQVGARARARREARQEARQQNQCKDRPIIGTHAFATKNTELIEFVRANARKMKRNGGYPFCDRQGNCWDANGNPVPKQPAQQQPKANPPASQEIKPNLPLPPKPGEKHKQPQAQDESDQPYSGNGRIPEDLRGRKHMAAEIDKLRKAHVIPGHPLPGTNSGETDVDPETLAPQPGPPAIDVSLHGKVDSLQNALSDVKTILSRPQPDLSTIHGKLDAVKQGIQDLGTLKGDVAALKQGQLDPAKLKLDLQNGLMAQVPNLLGPLEERLHSKIDALPDGMAKSVLESAPDVGKALAANAAPGLKAAAEAGISALIPGSGWIVGALGLLGGLPAGASLLNGFLARRQARKNGGPPPPHLPPAPPTNVSYPAPQPAPAPVAVQPPQPAPQYTPPSAQQTVLDTTFAQVMDDTWRTAYSLAKQDLARKEGIPSMNTIALFESLFNQRLGGQQIKPVKS